MSAVQMHAELLHEGARPCRRPPSALPEPMMEPEGHPAAATPLSSSRSRSAMGALLAAMLVISGSAGVLLSQSGDVPTLPRAGAVEHVNPPTHSAPGMIVPVAAGEVRKALASLALSDEQRELIAGQVEAGSVKLGWIVVSDIAAQDGDVVEISAAGVAQKVQLYSQPRSVAVPYVTGAPVRMKGVVDGDGQGITPALQVGSARLALRNMKPGEFVELPAP